MSPLVLGATARVLLPLILVISVFLLLRGHNEPGGGFVGGLVAASGFALHAAAFGVSSARDRLRRSPRFFIASGLAVALGSGAVGLLAGRPFLTGAWIERPLPVLGKFGTPVLFDVGVFLTVLGITLAILFSLMEEPE